MKLRSLTIIISGLIFLIPFIAIAQSDLRAKFEPADGECLFFIGQDLGAIGGLENYSDGYCDHFDIPAGFTVYTNFSPGAES